MKESTRQMAAVAEYLWHKGWAERNAGNMSVRLEADVRDLLPEESGRHIELEHACPSLEGHYLLLSGSGTRMRDLARNPERHTCLLHIGEGGRFFTLFHGESPELMPTSELPTHLSIHEKLLRDGRNETALLHTHVNEVIALTQIPEYTSEAAVNELIWGMHPETVLFIPEGIGFVPYTIPGTEEIARKTLDALENHRVIIWEKHGCLAVGKDLYDAFDQIDILAKSAGIFFTCRNAGFDPQGMTGEQLDELREKYL